MLVKLEKPELLSKAVELISELVTEVRLKVNEFGMSVTAMDPANVSLVNYKLPRSAFSEFNSESNEESLGVNLDNLKRILKRAGKSSSLILEKKDNLLSIQIIDKIKREFALALIEVESEEIDFQEKVSRMEFSSRVEIDSEYLISSIEDCAVIGDACSFKIVEGRFVIEAKGIDSARSEFSSDEVQIDAEDCKAKYSLEYLQKFVKGSKLVPKTKLQFAQDHPLRLDIRADDMEVSFILAPRVETED